MEGTNEKESLKCAGCLNDIGNDDYVSALSQDWHKDCFRCSVCDAALSSWYFEKAGLLFCQNDYWARYGESCQQCAQVITGPVMSAGEHRFHPECFACVACTAHIEDGEPYALLERSTLYCGTCYGSSGRRLVSRAHAIRVVEVPPAALRLAAQDTGLTLTDSRCSGKLSWLARAMLRAALAACIHLTCHRIDSSCGLLTLHIGDRILEINGTPVRNRPIDEIERVLATSEAVIQLTIEHNPETNNNTNKRTICNISDVDDKPKHDSKSPVERKIQEKKHIPLKHSVETEIDIESRKERLFKRKGEDGGKVRMMKRRQPSSPLLGDKERSSSMSKLLDVVEGEEPSGVLCDLSRARSFRADPAPGQKVFRASDLLQGELLGSGFFGQVYKVTHRDTNEVMVLKQLYRVDEDAQRNFLKEVAVLRSLSHPNVLRFVGVLYKDKRLHLVTEYVAGGTLHQLLQDRNTPLSWSARVRLARDVAAGVGYLHRMNVIHRDLNSHNCLVREDKTVIVADFGLARIVQRTASSTLERRRLNHHHARKRYTVVGNPYWMAPEMMNGNVYDEKVDVFSFGIILCEIIGRVSADPDYLPRRADFGLNEAWFVDKFCRERDREREREECTGASETAGACPEPFYRVAFLACDLDPDTRPPFEVIEIWLESLVMHLSNPGPLPPTLLADIQQYARGAAQHGHGTPECCQHHDTGIFCARNDRCCHCSKCGSCEKLRRSPSKVDSVELNLPTGVVKSSSNACIEPPTPTPGGRCGRAAALGKCVSASHITARARAAQAPALTLALSGSERARSRSHHALTTPAPGYILRADGDGNTINITKVDDITEWLEPPPPLKRTSPDHHLNNILPQTTKTRKVDETPDEFDGTLPAFLRNQSVEGLESKDKHDMDAPLPFCRHFSIPNNSDVQDDTDSSDDDLTESNWYRNVSSFKKMEVDLPKNILAGIKKDLLPKKNSYDVTDVTLRNPECMRSERKIPEVDCRRYNIDFLTKSPIMAEGVKNISRSVDQKPEKTADKAGFFAKKLLSPKLSRLFKPNTAEAVRSKPEIDESKEEKSRSKFFIQRPASPNNTGRSTYRVRPFEPERKPINVNKKLDSDVLKSDLKLASLGKPMTPIFRRHLPTERPDFADGRFSYRDRRSKFEPKEAKFVDIGRNRIKTPVLSVETKLTPLVRSSQINNIPALVPEKLSPLGVKDKNKEVKRREPGISRSNYVSLANLKINSKKDLEGGNGDLKSNDTSPVERVI